MGRLRLFVALSMLGALVAHGLDGYPLTGTNANLVSGNFVWVESSTSFPEGGWNNASGGPDTALAEFQLPFTAEAGVWYIQMKAIDYDKYHEAHFSFGNGAGTNWGRMSDRDTSRWLEYAIAITNAAPTDKLYARFFTTNTSAQLTILVLYPTTNRFEDVDPLGKDFIWNWLFPTSTNTSPTGTNNYLVTGSFEAGPGGWTVSQANMDTTPSQWILTDGDAQDGNACIKVATNNIELISPSFYAKSDHRQVTLTTSWKGSGTLELRTPVTSVVAGYSNAVKLTLTLPSVGSWTTTNVTFALLDYPPGISYYVAVKSGGTTARFDAIGVFESFSGFAPQGGFEIGWSNTVSSGVYYTNESATPRLIVSGPTEQTATVYWEWYDIGLSRVASGQSNVAMTAEGRHEISVPLPDRTGWFRGQAWSDCREPVENVIVRMPDAEDVGGEYLGTHMSPRPWQVQGLRRLGIRWTRAMSVSNPLRWTLAEPTDNNFVFFNQSAIVDNGVKILGGIGAHSESSLPAYAGDWDTGVDTTALTNNFYTLTRYYSVTNSWIDWYEVFNEPNQGGMPTAVYQDVLEDGAAAILSADPNAKIVAFSVGNTTAGRTMVETIMDSLGAGAADIIHAISTHSYPQGSKDEFSSDEALGASRAFYNNFYVPYCEPLGIEMWGTETGQWDWGGRLNTMYYVMAGEGVYAYAHQRLAFDGMAQVPWQLVQSAAAQKAYGASKLFHYDSRQQSITGADWTDNFTTSWDFGTDTHRPKIAALAMLNYVIGDAAPAGRELTNAVTTLTILYYEDGADSRAVLWANNSMPHNVTATNVVAVDWMLNPLPVTNNTFSVGRFPVYIYPDGLTSEQLQTNLVHATVVEDEDNTAPGVCIYGIPGARISDSSELEVRWAFVDERSIPDKNAQTLLLSRSALVPNGEQPAEEDYSEWGTTVIRKWTDLESVNVTVWVQGKDAADNITTVSRMFGEEPEPEPDPEGNKATIRAATIKNATL